MLAKAWYTCTKAFYLPKHSLHGQAQNVNSLRAYIRLHDEVSMIIMFLLQAHTFECGAAAPSPPPPTSVEC